MENRIRKKAVRGILAACVFACVLPGSGPVPRAMSGILSPASPEEMLRKSREQEALVTGENPDYIPDSRFLVGNRDQNDIRILSMTGQCLATGQEQAFYAVGKNYVPEGSVLPAVFGDRVEYSGTVECRLEQGGDVYALTRFAVRPVENEEDEDGAGDGAPPEKGDGVSPEKSYWNTGDSVIREIDGTGFRFRCIDQDYRGNALFLCDSVIPANTGSRYRYGPGGEGAHEYVFEPGPIVNFGGSSEYRDSPIRKWLKGLEEQFPGALTVNAGVTESYVGRTGSGTFDRFDQAAFRSKAMGSQRLMDRVFLLSMEEAWKYRDHLWDVEETASAFARGYWLRSPMSGDPGYVYVVDLEDGSIHPQPVRPDGSAEDRELAVTSPMGVRPAFVLPQRN